MPPLFPVGIAMTFELATYGFIIGFAYEKLPKKNVFIYASLIISMLLGRAVWGIVMAIIAGVSSVPFSMELFVKGAFVTALPGIALQIFLIPTIIIALKSAGHLKDTTKK